MKQPLLQVDQVAHNFGGLNVLKSISFTLYKGEIASILGPSGCGKTTLLRLIAGFEKLQSGEIKIENQCVAQRNFSVSPEKRGIGFVFQDFALFPHLNVEKNISFGLTQLSSRERNLRVSELVDLVGLRDKLASYPNELSGGQKQRVALARALAPRPKLLLLDEPFASLDTDLRSNLALEIRRILNELHMTAIFVTHNQTEAFDLSDQAGVLSDGVMHQWGSTFDLYHKPIDKFVADFVGQGVFLAARVLDGHHLDTEIGTIHCPDCQHYSKGAFVEILLRPEDVIHDDESQFKAEIVNRAFRGPYHLYTLKLPGSGRLVLSHVPSHHNHKIGEKIGLRLDCEHVVVVNTKNTF